MPRAAHGLTDDNSFRKRPATMRADAADRENLSARARDDNGFAIDLPLYDLALFQRLDRHAMLEVRACIRFGLRTHGDAPFSNLVEIHACLHWMPIGRKSSRPCRWRFPGTKLEKAHPIPQRRTGLENSMHARPGMMNGSSGRGELPLREAAVVIPTRLTVRPTRAEAEAAVTTLTRWTGDAPHRPGLVNTPGRVVRVYEEWFSGYAQDPVELLERTLGEIGGYDEPVELHGIGFHSFCEHHMAGIRGKTHSLTIEAGRITALDSEAPKRAARLNLGGGLLLPGLIDLHGGAISPGLRADLVHVRQAGGSLSVAAAWVAGGAGLRLWPTCYGMSLRRQVGFETADAVDAARR